MTCVLCFNINNKNPYVSRGDKLSFPNEQPWVVAKRQVKWTHYWVLRSSGTGICCSISDSDPPVYTQFVMLGLGLCRTMFSFACWVSVRIPVGSSGEWLKRLEGEETYPVQFAPCSCQQCPFIMAVHLVQVSRFYFHILWSGLIMPSWMQLYQLGSSLSSEVWVSLTLYVHRTHLF